LAGILADVEFDEHLTKTRATAFYTFLIRFKSRKHRMPDNLAGSNEWLYLKKAKIPKDSVVEVDDWSVHSEERCKR